MTFNLESVMLKTVMSCKTSQDIDGAKAFLKIASKHNFDIEILDEVAYLQNEIKDYRECVDTLKKVLAIANHPQEQYAIRANLAKVYNHLNEPKLSLAYSNVNLSLNNGKDYDTLMEIAFSNYLMGDYSKSESAMRDIISRPDLPDNVKGRVLYNLGSYDIEKGLFKQGLQGFIDVGHKIGIWKHTEISGIPIWDGSINEGRTILIHGEGGIGDEIICVRFMNAIKKLGMNPVWISNNADLAKVFIRNGYDCTHDVSRFKVGNVAQCQAMYLPLLLNVDLQDLWHGPYLKVCPTYVDKWRKLLPQGRKLLCKWSGNPHYEQDLHRSLPIDFMRSLDFDGTKINIQLEPELDQPDMFNVRTMVESIEDTLAIIELCDYAVTSCTSLAHMIGATGNAGSVCPPIATYYVWLGMNGCKSNWYDENLKVFRQTQHNDWSLVFDKVQREIRENNGN